MKIATATPVTPGHTLYSVTYSDTREFDRNVPYSYLQRLAAQHGYRVEVAARADVAAHTIEPTAEAE